MSETWVVNASPVILLAQVELASLLERLPDRLLIPQAVADEIAAGPPDDPARLLIERGWGERVVSPSIPADLLEWGLGPGETAVLGCVKAHAQGVAVLDDRLGRLAAKAHGVPVIGTLGVVLRAKRAGLLDAAAPVLRDLCRVGMFLHPAVIDEALHRVGERRLPD